MSKTRMIEILSGVYDFYGKDLTDFAIDVWMQACKTFDLEQVSKAFSRHLMDPEKGAFIPKPGDIVRQLQGTSTDRALLAWGKLYDAMGAVGAYTSVCFDDPAIHAAVTDLGGWVKLCRMDQNELSYAQHRFCEAYKAYTGRGTFEYPRALIGETDQANASRGIAGSSPVFIGLPHEAMRVFESGSKQRLHITKATDFLKLPINSGRE